MRTVFNLLGPLTNPANASHQLMGVYDAKLLPTVAAVLRELHVERALVVAGSDGLDELTVTGTSQIAELRDGEIRTYEIDPEQFGLRRHEKKRCAAETHAKTRRSFARCSLASAGRRATSCC